MNEDKSTTQILKAAQRKMKRAGWVSHYDNLTNSVTGIDRSPFYLRVRTTPKHRYLVVSNDLFRVDVKRPTCFEEVITFLTKVIAERREAIRKAEEQYARITKVRVWSVGVSHDRSGRILMRFFVEKVAKDLAAVLKKAIPCSDAVRSAVVAVEAGYTYLDIGEIDELKKQGIDVSVMPREKE